MESYSLLELNQRIRHELRNSMPDLYWIVAEINELNVNRAGHCFMELVEKEQDSTQITAKARATIWAYQLRMLAPYFESMTGKPLTAGLKIMLRASVEFHEIFGLSLQITDINPAYTIGDLALQRQKVIKLLKEEGVFDMNRELDIPVAPQRIAVISSETAAGYGDFVNQLYNSNYAFSHKLFQAVMQGNDAETSIIQAFEQIFDCEDQFDVVILIRGGGSQSDLNCFDSYQLAACIAQFSLPVITGIGHERDETIADLVACLSLKTPTAVAEYIIHQAMELDGFIQELENQLYEQAKFAIKKEAEKHIAYSQRLMNIIHSYVRKQDRQINMLELRLVNAGNMFLLQKKQLHSQLFANLKTASAKLINENKIYVERLEEKSHLLDHVNLLRRGYSITRANGKVVRNAENLQKGQEIETILYEGKIKTVFVSCEK